MRELVEHNKINVLSFWIMIWVLLYLFGLIDYNPTLILIIAQIVMLFSLYSMHFEGCLHFDTALARFIYISLSKFLPMYILWLHNDVVISERDMYFHIGMFLLYCIMIYLNNLNLIKVYTDIFINHKCKYLSLNKNKMLN